MFCCVSILIASIPATDTANPSEQELRKLSGVYRFDMVEVDGVKRPELPFATNKVIILEDGRFVIMQGAQITHGTLKVDVTKTPRQYDSTLTRGPNKGLTFPCIYELDAETFKLCGPYAGGQRPVSFTTASGSGLIMQILKREKQTLQEALAQAGRKELEGTWEGTSLTRDGKAESQDAAKTLRLTFDANGQVSEVAADGAARKATSRIDALGDPMAIDFAYIDGELKGQTWLSVAQVDGATLTICSANPGAPRPKALVCGAGTGTTLVTYQRAAAGN